MVDQEPTIGRLGTRVRLSEGRALDTWLLEVIVSADALPDGVTILNRGRSGEVTAMAAHLRGPQATVEAVATELCRDLGRVGALGVVAEPNPRLT